MALNRNGRILYFDAPGTYLAVFAAKEFVRLDEVQLVAAGAAATMDIYADPAATATKKIISLAAAINGIDEFIIASDETKVPDSMNGLTVVIAGAGATAFIWLA